MTIRKHACAAGISLAATLALAAPALAEMTMSLGGRIQVDATLFDEDDRDLDSGTEFRRVRLFAEGDIADNWGYKSQIDFAGNETTLKDMYISYSGFDFGKIKIGQFKHEFGLDTLTSSKYITFIERAASMEAFAIDRRIGVGLAGDLDRWHYAFSVFGQEESSDEGADEGVGAAGRVTWAPQFGDNSFLHLGAAANWQEPESTDDSEWRVRARPEAHQSNIRFVDTGTLEDVNNITTYGFEGAYVFGPFSVQGEWMQQTVDRDNGDDPELSGWYAYGSWFLTGESRAYKSGSFGRTKATNAWEIAVRYSSTDLDDGDVRGGQQDIITVGLNYYVNPYLRFMLNYVNIDADPVADRLIDRDDETGLIVGPGEDENPSAVIFRAAMDFK